MVGLNRLISGPHQLVLTIHSISGNVLKDPDAKLNEAELKSIGLTVSFDF